MQERLQGRFGGAGAARMEKLFNKELEGEAKRKEALEARRRAFDDDDDAAVVYESVVRQRKEKVVDETSKLALESGRIVRDMPAAKSGDSSAAPPAPWSSASAEKVPPVGDCDHYDMSHRRRGVALILNHNSVVFRDQQLDRRGTSKDREALVLKHIHFKWHNPDFLFRFSTIPCTPSTLRSVFVTTSARATSTTSSSTLPPWRTTPTPTASSSPSSRTAAGRRRSTRGTRRTRRTCCGETT